MAVTPESVVYRGTEGTGAAQVFGRAGDPLRAVLLRKQENAQRELKLAEQQRLMKEKRDKKVGELLSISPDKAYQPFNEQILGLASKHRTNIQNYLDGGGDPESPSFQGAVKRGWESINDQAGKSNYIKSKLDEAIKSISDSPYQKDQLQSYYLPKLNDVWMNPDGSAKPLDNIDVNQLQQIVNDAGGYNLDKYTEDFVANPKENITSWIKKRNTSYGLEYDDYKLKHSSFFTPDQNTASGVKEDAQGNPIITINKDVRNAFIDGSGMKKQAIESAAAAAGVTTDEWIDNKIAEKIRKQGTGFQLDIAPHFNRDRPIPQWMYERTPGLKPDEKKLVNNAMADINSMVNAFYNADGSERDTPSPNALAAAGHLKKGDKFGNGVIVENTFVKGTNTPGSSTVMGKKLANSPDDRFVIKIRSGQAGLERLEEFNLTEEGAPATLFNSYKDTGYFGKKQLNFDTAAEELGIDPKTVYKGRALKGAAQVEEQDQLGKWATGEDGDALKDKTYKGKKIIGVERLSSRTFRHPIDGEFNGFKVTLSDGTQETITKDDYESFTKIYRSKSSGRTGGTKSTGVKWD